MSIYWKRYHKALSDKPDLETDIDCGGWQNVRYLQDMVHRHVKPSADTNLVSKIYKPGYKPNISDSDDATRGDEGGSGSSSLVSSFENFRLSTPERKSRPVVAIHETPMPEAYDMGTRSAANQSSVDEMYANASLLALLQETRNEIEGHMKLCNWVMPLLGLHLTTLTDPLDVKGKNRVLKPKQQKLMQAQVDGYLCRRSSSYDFYPTPLAICETKPFVRNERYEATLRQETAEMACWISQHRNSSEGRLRDSHSGRRRRLLISQDRQEIYIVIGEYGKEYEQYISGEIALLAMAPTVKPGSNFDADANRRAAEGSGSYNEQVEWSGLITAGTSAGPGPRIPQEPASQPRSRKRLAPAEPAGPSGPQRTGMRTRSQTPPAPQRLPPVEEFLVMHQFGPFLITQAGHMSHFVRRLIAFLLELNGASKS